MTFRNYQGPEDIALQHAFWVAATRDLPWCWKPTASPTLYSKGRQFDPRSRCFAFEDGRLIGYMSFTGEGEFVSLGYPWVLPGYEGELQRELYRRVYGFAASPEYGGKSFAQRFRRQWTRQIDFFLERGFTERSEAIYACPVAGRGAMDSTGRYRITVEAGFRIEAFEQLSAKLLCAGQLRMLRTYFPSVDFDFAVTATRQRELAAYFGVTLRRDTGFAELIASAIDPSAADAIAPSLLAAVGELRRRNARFLATKLLPGDDHAEILTSLGFSKVTEEVFLSRNIPV
jgi:hypothetical protein